MPENDWLLTCAPIGTLEISRQFWEVRACGVFIYDNPFIWYATSYQKISVKDETSLYLLLRHKKETQVLFDITSMHHRENINWLYDEKNDIAITLFPVDPNFDIKAIEIENLLDSQDMQLGMNCYSIGCTINEEEHNQEKVQSYVLAGIISKIDSDHTKIYVTTPILPKNFGCPIFVWKSPVNSKNFIGNGNPSIHLGGIITKNISLSTDEKNVNPIILNVMSPSKWIRKLIFSPEALAQKEQIKIKNKH